MWVEATEGWRVEVVTLAPGAFPDAREAELYLLNGEGGTARLELWNGTASRWNGTASRRSAPRRKQGRPGGAGARRSGALLSPVGGFEV